jgi:predicted dehydrogenase
MIKKFLFIGYGNMTKKYCNILKQYKKKIIIKFYTKQKIPNNLFYEANEFKKYDPDIIFICSSTINHYSDLKFANKIFKNKVIFVEKPLYHKFFQLKNIKNKIYINYNLRYDLLLQYLKKILDKKKIWSLEIFCKSFLPNWRKSNYTKSYSSKKILGGGVLLDLSHELDYLTWIFGKIEINFVQNNKISDLRIDSDDNLLLVGKTKNIKQILIHLNYYSRIEQRSISVTSKNLTFNADLINKKIYFFNNKSQQYVKSWSEKGFQITYDRLIKDIVNTNKIKLPDLKFSLKVQKLISRIQEQK